MPTELFLGHAKSVQDLVTKFEWSQDVSRKDRVVLQRSKTASQLEPNSERKEYFSLPPIVVKKTTSTEPVANATTTNIVSGDAVEKNGESIRRDRIEKYKEERRQMLRQRYQMDECLNDQEEEEMIRRIKQKISKNENGSTTNEVQNRLEFDSSPSDENEQLLAKDISDKPPTAVTTINILYKSRTSDVNSEASVAVEERVPLERSESSRTKDSIGLLSKSYNLVSEPTKDWSSKNTVGSDSNRRSFTSSLERKVKSFARQESLVAKRVNQFAEASESTELACKRNGESGSVKIFTLIAPLGLIC